MPTLLCGGTENQASCRRAHYRGSASKWRACAASGRRQAQRRGIPLSDYPIPGFYSFAAVAQMAKFARRMAKQRIDVMHAYSFYGNVFGILPSRLAGTPVVIASIRDRAAYLTPMQKRVQRFVCRFADCVLVNAEAVKDWLTSEGYNPATIVVIPNGVELDRFSERPDPERVRRELGIAAGSPMVMVVSRLTRQKGLEQFLEAAQMLAPRFPDARFVIVGYANPAEQEYEDALKALTERLGLSDRVIFTGLRQDVPALLAGATVSVMPSLNEALSNVLLESMAAGAPTVATRVGGTPEAIVDEVTGLIVEPGDASALAEAVARLLNEPASRAGLATPRAKRSSMATLSRRWCAQPNLCTLDLLARKTAEDSAGFSHVLGRPGLR